MTRQLTDGTLAPMKVSPTATSLPQDDLVLHEAESPKGGHFLIIKPAYTPPTGLSEADEQQEGVYLLRRRKELVFAVPNDADRTSAAAAQAKRTGLLKGAADLTWVTRRGWSVFIEMKKTSGAFSDIEPQQTVFLGGVGERGQLAVVCFGYRALRFVVNNVEALDTYCRHINGKGPR